MNVSEYAKQNSISKITVYRMIKRGEINHKILPTGTIVILEDKEIKPEYTVVYSRVSSSQNKGNLNSQSERCVSFCNAKGKIRKKFNNKLQRWSYSKVLNKLQNMTEEAGVILTKVNPAHTSQKCCKCGVICKSNRKGEIYKCACGNNIDADFNAAINLSHMGVYSPHVLY